MNPEKITPQAEGERRTPEYIPLRRTVLKITLGVSLALFGHVSIAPVLKILREVGDRLARRNVVDLESVQLDRKVDLQIDERTQGYDNPFINATYASEQGGEPLFVSFGNHGHRENKAEAIALPPGIDTVLPDSFPSLFLFGNITTSAIVKTRVAAFEGKREMTFSADELPHNLSELINEAMSMYLQWIPINEPSYKFIGVDTIPPQAPGLMDFYLSMLNDETTQTFTSSALNLIRKMGIITYLSGVNNGIVGNLEQKPIRTESRREFLKKSPIRMAMVGLTVSSLGDAATAISAAKEEIDFTTTFFHDYPKRENITPENFFHVFASALEQSEKLSPELRAHVWRDLVSVYKIVYYYEKNPTTKMMAAWGNFHLNQLGMYALKSEKLLDFIQFFLKKHGPEVKSWYPSGIDSIYTLTHMDIKNENKSPALDNVRVEIIPELFQLLLARGFF